MRELDNLNTPHEEGYHLSYTFPRSIILKHPSGEERTALYNSEAGKIISVIWKQLPDSFVVHKDHILYTLLDLTWRHANFGESGHG